MSGRNCLRAESRSDSDSMNLEDQLRWTRYGKISLGRVVGELASFFGVSAY